MTVSAHDVKRRTSAKHINGNKEQRINEITEVATDMNFMKEQTSRVIRNDTWLFQQQNQVNDNVERVETIRNFIAIHFGIDNLSGISAGQPTLDKTFLSEVPIEHFRQTACKGFQNH